MPDQTPVQIAWVTHDLDATETDLTQLMGAKKWVRMPSVHFAPDACTHRGRPADFVANVSLSYAGDTQLELIEPVRGESIYSEFLDGSGSGLHHVAVEAASPERFDEMLGDAERDGASVVCRGVMPGGMRFAYLSAAQAGIPYLEVMHIPSEIRAFFDYVKQEQV